MEPAQKMVEIAPHDAFVWSRLGRAFEEQERYVEALDAYNKALTFNSADLWAWAAKGRMLLRLDRANDASQAMKQASRYDGNKTRSLLARVISLQEVKDFEKALFFALKAVQSAPYNAECWYVLGLNYSVLDRLAEAEDAFSHAIQCDSQFVKARSARGMVLGDMDRCDEALNCLQTAVRLAPDDSGSWLDYVSVLIKLERYEEVLESLNHVQKLDSDYTTLRFHNYTGIALYCLGRYAEAVQEFAVVARLKPDVGTVYVDLGESSFAAGQIKPALTEFLKAAELSPDLNDP